MFLVIDNYDSFTYNLVHLFGMNGMQMKVIRNDMLTVEQALAMGAEGIILSPGPGVPEKAGICVELIKKAAGHLPIFGVCLGMQAIGHAFGGRIIRANCLMHGKTSSIVHEEDGIFAHVPSPFHATRYHSLVVDPANLPAKLCVTARDIESTVMGLSHLHYPIHGVQFHPESIASEYGNKIVQNFIALAKTHAASRS